MSFIRIDEKALNDALNWHELFKLPVKEHPGLLKRFYESLKAIQHNKKYSEWHMQVRACLVENHPVASVIDAIHSIPQEERLPLIFYAHWEMRSYLSTLNLLHYITEYHCPAEHMRAVLECIPQDMLPYINIANKLFHQQEKLDIYISMLSELGRWILFNLVDKNRDRLLHQAAFSPKVFKKVLDLENDKDAKRRALTAKNKQQVSVLQRAAHNESFETAFLLISEEDRHHVVGDSDENGSQLIHYARTQRNMLWVLSYIPPQDHWMALTHKPNFREPAIAMACQNDEWLQAVLTLLSPDLWPEAMKAAGEEGHRLVKALAREPAKMLEVLGFYHEDDRLAAVPDAELMLATPETVLAVMSLLPATNRERPHHVIRWVSDKVSMLERDHISFNNSFLVRYAKNNMQNAMKVLEEGLPDNGERYKAIKLSDGVILLDVAAMSGNIAAFTRIFHLYPENERAALFSSTYGSYGCSDARYRYSAARTIKQKHDWIKIAMLSLPEQDRLRALETEVRDLSDTREVSLLYFHYGIFQLPKLAQILLLLPIQDLQRALNSNLSSCSEKRGCFDIKMKDAYVSLTLEERARIVFGLMGNDDKTFPKAMPLQDQVALFEAAAVCVVLTRANNATQGHPIEKLPTECMEHLIQYILPRNVSSASGKIFYGNIQYARNNLCALFGYRPDKNTEVNIIEEKAGKLSQ